MAADFLILAQNSKVGNQGSYWGLILVGRLKHTSFPTKGKIGLHPSHCKSNYRSKLLTAFGCCPLWILFKVCVADRFLCFFFFFFFFFFFVEKCSVKHVFFLVRWMLPSPLYRTTSCTTLDQVQLSHFLIKYHNEPNIKPRLFNLF